MKRHLFVLLGSLFVVMIGFGITLAVLPFYVERLALEGGASRQAIVLHVTLLTGVYAVEACSSGGQTRRICSAGQYCRRSPCLSGGRRWALRARPNSLVNENAISITMRRYHNELLQ